MRPCFLVLVLVFLVACSTAAPVSISPGDTPTDSPVPSPTGLPGVPASTVEPIAPAQKTATLDPVVTVTVEPTHAPEIDWREAPIMPEMTERVLAIYRQGQEQGRDSTHFSVIGDCQSIPYVFLGPFGRGDQKPPENEAHLWKAIRYFRASFDRWSVTSRGGFTAASILNPMQADPNYCKPGETPLTCEYRLHNPAFVFITLETWLDPATVNRYETYLRQIVEYVLARGSVPILLTKADASEAVDGTLVINPAIVRVARDYDVPLINFWRAAQYLPNRGIDPEREGFHLSPAGYNLKNLLALRTLYLLWQGVSSAGANASASAPTPTPAVTGSDGETVALQVPALDCRGGCIFFALMTSHDGQIASQGVYAYLYAPRQLVRVLPPGFDLQDVSRDGRRLLVNQGGNLYEVNRTDSSTRLLSSSFFFLGRQGAHWEADEQGVFFLDQNRPIQTETGRAFHLFPSGRQGEYYLESGTCEAKDYCRSTGIYRLTGEGLRRLENFARPVFSSDGRKVAYLNPAAATAENYYHIGYLLLEEPDRGVASRRVFYFPQEHGFMVYPDVRAYAFSPDGNMLFVLLDAYSDYYENSLRLRNYAIDLRTGLLRAYGTLEGAAGSLNPRLVWSPEGDRVLLALTEKSEGLYALHLYQVNLAGGEPLTVYQRDLFTSPDYFYITNLYWRLEESR